VVDGGDVSAAIASSRAGAVRHVGRRLERIRRCARGRVGLELALGRLELPTGLVAQLGVLWVDLYQRVRDHRRRGHSREPLCGRPG
jgi:hypothetical protein